MAIRALRAWNSQDDPSASGHPGLTAGVGGRPLPGASGSARNLNEYARQYNANMNAPKPPAAANITELAKNYNLTHPAPKQPKFVPGEQSERQQAAEQLWQDQLKAADDAKKIIVTRDTSAEDYAAMNEQQRTAVDYNGLVYSAAQGGKSEMEQMLGALGKPDPNLSIDDYMSMKGGVTTDELTKLDGTSPTTLKALRVPDLVNQLKAEISDPASDWQWANLNDHVSNYLEGKKAEALNGIDGADPNMNYSETDTEARFRMIFEELADTDLADWDSTSVQKDLTDAGIDPTAWWSYAHTRLNRFATAGEGAELVPGGSVSNVRDPREYASKLGISLEG